MISPLSSSEMKRLIEAENLDVMSELLQLNRQPFYQNTLDVIKLTRIIQLERIRFFLSKKQKR